MPLKWLVTVWEKGCTVVEAETSDEAMVKVANTNPDAWDKPPTSFAREYRVEKYKPTKGDDDRE